MTIQKARETLGKRAEKLTDQQVEDIERRLRVLVNLTIDKVLSMTPEERKVLDEKIKNEKKAKKK